MDARTAEQNRTQFPILQAFADQLMWPINGVMVYMDKYDWKDVLSAAFRKEAVRLAPGLDGGIVMLGMRTSKMDKATFSSWIDFLYATAAHRDVIVHPEDESAEPQ